MTRPKTWSCKARGAHWSSSVPISLHPHTHTYACRAETPRVCGKSRGETDTIAVAFPLPASSSAPECHLSAFPTTTTPRPPHTCAASRSSFPSPCSPAARGPTTTWGAHIANSVAIWQCTVFPTGSLPCACAIKSNQQGVRGNGVS